VGLAIDNPKLKQAIFLLLSLLCLAPFSSPPIALLLGLLASQIIPKAFSNISKISKMLLQYSVVGLGFGMNLYSAIKVSQDGVILTAIFITSTILIGLLVGKYLAIKRNTTLLIASGTAICGGSAIAAVAPIIEASEDEMSVSLGIVFILNSVALIMFPILGHYFNLSQMQFGMWSAIAIHDTSSVVGAAQSYGNEALQIATTVKLGRALWIVPLSLAVSIFFKQGKKKISIPYFILYFILAMVVSTFIPAIQSFSPYIVVVAKKGLTLTLFLIGAGMTKESLKTVGFKPLILGVGLWILVLVSSLLLVMKYY